MSPLRLQLKLPSRSKAAFPLPKVDLLMNGHVVFGESYFVAHLHFVKEPIRIALENLGKMNSNVASRLAKSVHDSAQGGFVDAEHSCQTVLPDARGVHPQFQVRVNVSIQCHDDFALVCIGRSILWTPEEAVSEKTLSNLCTKPGSTYLSTYCCGKIVR